MRGSAALICTAIGAFVLAIGAGRDASALPPPMVNDALIQGDTMPRLLGDFGFFRDGYGRDPDARLIGYELNTPLWSDGADKIRYLYIPEGSVIEADGEGLLQFPVGTAIIKTFAFGEGEDQRFVETRVLLNRTDGWIALPYRWNEQQTEARLALAGGRLPITTPEGEDISYRIPNKNQCKACHQLEGEVIPIGPKARNLPTELLETLVADGRLKAMPSVGDYLPVWDRFDGTGDVEALARAYLDVNCAHCHQPGGGASNSGLDLRFEQDDPFAIGIDKPPVAAGRGAGGHLVSIAPGDPDASILVYRMNSNDPGIAMPELGRATIDTRAVEMMRRWIAEMDR